MNLMKVLDQYALLPGAHMRRLREVVAENLPLLVPPQVYRSVSLDDVPFWDSFGTDSRLVKGLDDLVISDEPLHTTVNIRSIEGMGASKSPMHAHEDLDSWAEKYAQWAIQDVSKSAAERLLAWRREDTTTDTLSVHDYDGRIFLSNSEGSHRFAAARYIAGKLDEPIYFTAPMYRYRIDREVLAQAKSTFSIFAVRDNPKLILALRDACDLGKVPVDTLAMPPRLGQGVRTTGEGGERYRAIALPNGVPQAKPIISALRDAGVMDVLSELERQLSIAYQRAHPAKEPEPAGPRP